MKKIYTEENLALLWCVRNELENSGVSCEVRNDMLAGAAGDIPLTECWPEIWIHDERDTEKARAVIAVTMRRREQPGRDWQCPGCGEEHGGQFGTCWNCGSSRKLNPG